MEQELDDQIKSVIEDKNNNGIYDSDEIIEAEKKIQLLDKKNQKDIFKLFYFIYTFTFILAIAKFIIFVFLDININFDLGKLANTLNIAITFIGYAEGLRSFTASINQQQGESSPVPAYKLKYLFGYLISFSIITLSCVAFDFIVQYLVKSQEFKSEIPDFCTDSFLNGMISNVLAYLIARYGNKIAQNIDISEMKFFKIKK